MPDNMKKYAMTMPGLYDGIYCWCFHTSPEGAVAAMMSGRDLLEGFEAHYGRPMVAADWHAEEVAQ